MPFSRLADKIIAASPHMRGQHRSGLASGVAGASAIGILGSLMNNDDG
jgi:hypothetical protein